MEARSGQNSLFLIAYLLFISIHNWNYFHLWFELNLLRIIFIHIPELILSILK